MAKRLTFFGHPPEPVTLRGARKYMGCAVKNESDALVIATHGEWDSRKEGRADMRLVTIVPEDMQLEQRTELSGPDSAATGPDRGFGAGHDEDGCWYTPKTPANGWTAVPDVPDPDRTAKQRAQRQKAVAYQKGVCRVTVDRRTTLRRRS
jgi:hypothetical protein